MDARVDLEELLELLKIQKFELLLASKITELKQVLKDEISFYRDITKSFKKTGFPNMYLYESNIPKREAVIHRFELNRLENGGWFAGKIVPAPPEGTFLNDTIPPKIIKHITGYKTDPLKMNRYSGIADTSTGKKLFEVEFIKDRKNHLSGTIRKREMMEGFSPALSKLDIINATWNYKKAEEQENYSELFHYMQVYPEVRKRIFEDFFFRIKPRIDSRNL